jgi:uridine kinase
MPKPITITISGCPVSGKSTLAYLLENLLPTAFTIQQDDFEASNSTLHSNDVAASGQTDSFDLTALEEVIRRCQETGDMPPESTNRQASKGFDIARQNAINTIPEGERNALKERLLAAIGPHKIGVVEGRSLHQDPGLLAGADVRLFLRASKATAKERQAAGPDTEDRQRTEAFFEKAVWPKYVQESAFLFNGDDVEGAPNSTICELMDILVQPSLESSVDETLKWAVDSICHISTRE